MGGKASAFSSAACSSGEQAALCQQPPHSAAPPAQVILCFSPVGSTLRVRARRFPAVVNCTAIDWFHEWPEDALVSVSSRFLEETGDIEVSAAGSRVRAQRTARGAAAASCSLLPAHGTPGMGVGTSSQLVLVSEAAASHGARGMKLLKDTTTNSQDQLSRSAAQAKLGGGSLGKTKAGLKNKCLCCDCLHFPAVRCAAVVKQRSDCWLLPLNVLLTLHKHLDHPSCVCCSSATGRLTVLFCCSPR